MQRQKKRTLTALLFFCCGIFSQGALAANFQLFEQSATLLGQADAGTGVSDDPSVQYYNPAAMILFNKTTVGFSGIYIAPEINFEPTTATNLFGQPITGNFNSPAKSAMVPAFYIIQPLSPRIVAGLGFTVPFGLATNYGNQSLARYFATTSNLKSYNINPSVAYAFTDNLSFGFGFDLQYLSATLNQAADANSILSPSSGPGDIYLDNNAHDWSLGWNLGLFYKPWQHTRVGLSYRSKVEHSLDGGMSLENPPTDPEMQDLIRFYGLTDSNVSGDITLPAYTTLSIQQDLTPRWSIMSDIAYIQWNVIQQIALNFSPKNPSLLPWTLPPDVIPLHYHNTWRLALGQSIKLTQQLTGRTGIAFDQSPLKEDYATARIPDTSRFWLTFGLGYAVTQHTNINLGYAHIFFHNSSVYQTETVPEVGTATLAAKYNGHANLFGLQLNTQFG